MYINDLKDPKYLKIISYLENISIKNVNIC